MTGTPSVGLWYGHAVSDAYGHFRVSGLRPGRHDVRMVPPKFRRTEWEVPSVATSTGGEPVKVMVPCARVLVRVLDETGAPLVAAGCTACFPGRLRRVDRLWGETREDGTLNVWAKAGETVYVAAVAPGLGPAEREVVVPTDVWEQDLTLVLRPLAAGGFGRLRVEARFPDGVAVGAFAATLQTPRTGTSVPGFRSLPHGPGAEALELPTGLWRLYLSRTGREEGDARWLSTKPEVVIRTDADTTLSVVVGAGGRVEVPVTLEEGGPAETDLVVRLEPRGMQGAHWIREFYTAKTHVKRLPSGPWHLRATANGYRTVEQDFVVEDGGDQSVPVHLVVE